MQQLDRPAALEAPADDAGFTPASLRLAPDGAERFHGADTILAGLRDIADGLPQSLAGVRLHGIPALQTLLDVNGPLGGIAAARLGVDSRPVRAILFDKTPGMNWALGWHQDRTIVVRQRVATPGFGPWTVKAGLIHVAPPAELLSTMLTMRVHLDDVPETNGPLLIAPGSHLLGKIAEPDIDAIVARCGVATCLAAAGDVWLYATPILHASAASDGLRRRVLQVDFAAAALPNQLEWLGV